MKVPFVSLLLLEAAHASHNTPSPPRPPPRPLNLNEPSCQRTCRIAGVQKTCAELTPFQTCAQNAILGCSTCDECCVANLPLPPAAPGSIYQCQNTCCRDRYRDPRDQISWGPSCYNKYEWKSSDGFCNDGGPAVRIEQSRPVTIAGASMPGEAEMPSPLNARFSPDANRRS